MLFTIGKIEIYEPYIDSNSNAAKGKSGSVWKILEEVQECLDKQPSNRDYCIYGVEADWSLDTKVVEGENWRSLIRSAKLVRLETCQNGY